MQTPKSNLKKFRAPLALLILTLLSAVALGQSTTTTVAGVTEKPVQPASNPEGATAADPDYLAPYRSSRPTVRVGIDAGTPVPLTLNDAIKLALENNNDIAASRIDVEMGEHDLTAARGAYDPRTTSEYSFTHSTTPFATFLGGTDNGRLKEDDFTSKFSLSGLSPKAGGSYKVEFSSSRLSSNNFFNDLNPTSTTGFSLSYTQPLMRGRRIDDTRRRIEIAKKNLTLTDVQFRQKASDVITQVEQAYWGLVYALKNLQVQTDAVNQTKAQVETNKRQVNQGVLAPIDVVEAESQVKIYEQNVYVAQEEVTRSENALKTLLLPDRKADLWSRALMPITPVSLEVPQVSLDEAVMVALANRLELAELRTDRKINQIDRSFYKDQTRPQVDVTVGYSSTGLAGDLNDVDNPLRSSLTSLQTRVAELSAQAGLPPLPATAFAAVPNDMRGGYGQSLSNLLAQDNPTVSFGVTISLPFRNRTAKAQLAHSMAEGRRIETMKTKTEQVIEADVRNTMQAVKSVEARLTAARASLTAAEQQYTSEQRKFRAGMSTVFLVLQRQTDLVAARGREVQTQTDLNKAIAEFQRATGNTLNYRSVTVITDGHRLEQRENSAAVAAVAGGASGQDR